jgi:probable rRNA maturation factor
MIYFHTEDTDYQLLNVQKIKRWIRSIIESEGFKLKEINYVFCSDTYLHRINLEYLDHDTFTDIITFDNSEKENEIEGDIFISVDRVKENANDFEIDFETELRRVLAHGILHLCGYHDETDEEETQMRTKENQYLATISEI